MNSEIREYLPFIIPLLIVQIALLGYSVFHILTHENYKHGNRALWLIIAIFINVLGPILYFVFGKEED